MTQAPIDYGVRIENSLNAFIPESCAIKPQKDWLVIEPLEWEPSSTIKVVHANKTLRGKVLAVGPGRYPLKYDGPKGKRTKSWDSKTFVKTEIKCGDTVELGGLEIGGYLFQTFLWGAKKVVMCREADVAIVYD